MAAQNIALIGLPGSGKTSLGRQAADLLGMPFIDIDDEIVRQAGQPITAIFAESGEEYFRELEAEQVQRAAAGTAASAVVDSVAGVVSGAIIACGGGAVLRRENVAALKANCLLVFIDRPVLDIAGDIESDSRPLLAGQVGRLFELAEQRDPIYRELADVVIDNSGSELQALAALVALARSPQPGCRLAVIGDPIMHSLSPIVHNAVLEELESSISPDPGSYQAIWVLPSQLESFVAAARATDLVGFNVTIPHKQAVIPLLDELDVTAARAGAVNTVIARASRLIGYNTDMPGFKAALKAAGYSLSQSNITILGTGGAARALALLAADEQAASIRLLGRDAAKAEQLANDIRQRSEDLIHNEAIIHNGDLIHSTTLITSSGLSQPELKQAAQTTDILINATPLGMEGYPDDFGSLEFLQALPNNALVFDLVYAPPRTSLLTEAEKLGLATQNGLSMLIYQALLADELFLGRELPKPALFNKVNTALSNIQGG